MVAVADGAGSATHSEIGSRLVCDELVRHVRESLEQYHRVDVRAAFRSAREVVRAEADKLSLRPRDLAATALLAVVGPDGASFGQVGDGAIIVGDEANYRAVFWPEVEEFVNVTHFLTDENYERHLMIADVAEVVHDLAVMTDGVQWLALDYATRQPHPAFFRPAFAHLRATSDPDSLRVPFRSFLDSERVNALTDDDKTLVLASRTSSPLSP